MAQKVAVQLVDDLDGTQSDGISTVTFGLDGVTYEIDLTQANADNLRETLEEYITHAPSYRRPCQARYRSGSAAARREQAQAVRKWARKKGLEVSDRGRIPANITEAFEAAQAQASTATSTRRTKRTKASTAA
jgi:hypothetical protein